MAKTNVLVIYHAGCWDGFCAAWLFSHAYPEAEFHPAHYSTEPPDVEGKVVYIVDFSYKREVMSAIISQAYKVCVLDHHPTAQKELTFPSCSAAEFVKWNARVYIHFDTSKSGARLAWEFLYGNHLLPVADWFDVSDGGYSLGIPPWLVSYTEDRDLWRWALPNSREINAALRTYPLSLDEWDKLHFYGKTAPGRRKLVAAGQAILRREQQIVRDHVGFARETEIGGHKVLAVNATVLTSEIAGELAKGRPFGACWFERFDGKRIWSLRSEEGGLDVSEVAKSYGGGGHPRAAGYEV